MTWYGVKSYFVLQALDQVKVLQQAAEDMKMNNESTDQVEL